MTSPEDSTSKAETPHRTDPDETPSRLRWRRPLLALLAGAALVTTVTVLTRDAQRPEPVADTRSTPASQQGALLQSVHSLQGRLRRLPEDTAGWASLGSAYVELARVSADPTYYGKAQDALNRSLALRPEGNGPAMLGMGSLANARHDFAAARDWALRAEVVAPGSAEVQGVLADALTQLGDDSAATAAVQRMLDLRPGVAAFSRASYHFELHGRDTDARDAMERALGAAATPDEIAFCRYYLGELAFNSGRLDEAAEHYEQGIAVAAQDVTLLQGRAKAAAARGDLPRALEEYRQVVQRAPLPQYLTEYGELLDAAGRGPEAARQYALITQQHRLLETQGATDDLSAALFLADHGDKAEALRRAEAEWGRRRSVFVADALAWALHVNGRSAEALPLAEQAASLGWRNATMAYHRGMILAGLGRADEAAGFLAEALRINPQFSALHAPIATQVLGELRSR